MTKESLLAKYLNIGGSLFLTIIVPLIFLASSTRLTGGAEIFPMLMSGLMLFCGAMSFYGRFRKGDMLGTSVRGISFSKLSLSAAILFLFIPLSESLGFYATSFIYIVSGFLFLAGGVTVKYALQAVMVAGLFVFAEKMIFYDLLTILTPTGILF